jgi:hypothetical protein
MALASVKTVIRHNQNLGIVYYLENGTDDRLSPTMAFLFLSLFLQSAQDHGAILIKITDCFGFGSEDKFIDLEQPQHEKQTIILTDSFMSFWIKPYLNGFTTKCQRWGSLWPRYLSPRLCLARSKCK